jgi:hypothetical protein
MQKSLQKQLASGECTKGRRWLWGYWHWETKQGITYQEPSQVFQ